MSRRAERGRLERTLRLDALLDGRGNIEGTLISSSRNVLRLCLLFKAFLEAICRSNVAEHHNCITAVE